MKWYEFVRKVQPFQETPAEARRLWTESLRSGEYSEGQVFLHLSDGNGRIRNCCLGVACELFRKRYPESLETRDIALSAIGYVAVEFYDGSDVPQRFCLPNVVREWLGLADGWGHFKTPLPDGTVSLADASDARYGFARLADLIDGDVLALEGECSPRPPLESPGRSASFDGPSTTATAANWSDSHRSLH